MNARKRQSGMTLVELLVASAILLVAVALASSLMITGVRLTRDGEIRVQESDEARMAMGELAKSVRLAGLGAPNGLYVHSNGKNQLVSPIFGTDGSATAPDEMWVVVPDGNAMREGCPSLGSTAGDPGAATRIASVKLGLPTVICTGTFADGDMLMSSNLRTGALLTASVLDATLGTISFAEVSSGLSTSPTKSSLQVGDLVFRVNVWHYFVDRDANGVPGLYRAKVKTSTGGGGTVTNAKTALAKQPATAALFVDDGAPTLVQQNIEDLQIAYGLDYAGNGDPAGFIWVDGLGSAPQFSAAGLGGTALSNLSALGGAGGLVSSRQDLLGGTTNALRAIRVSVVVRGSGLSQTGSGTPSTATPLAKVENHVQTGANPDGYRRMLASRTFELPNLSPGSL